MPLLGLALMPFACSLNRVVYMNMRNVDRQRFAAEPEGEFAARHIGPDDSAIDSMLRALGLRSLAELADQALPRQIRSRGSLGLEAALSEDELLKEAHRIASKNRVCKSYIGMGYYDCFTPPVIQRNILENPGWYTAYTPYQSEISQGRLEALLNFQTMVMDLTGMAIANASLLDEATAVAEAATMVFHAQRKSPTRKLFVSGEVFPQSLEVLGTRAEPLGVEVVRGAGTVGMEGAFAAVIQYPAANGMIPDLRPFIKECRERGIASIVVADLLALCVLTPPGEMGADIVVGSAQRFGVPLAFGGPHAAYLAADEKYTRIIPGRLVGVSKDIHGRTALRLALQTREQHIRREKATSNICTAQVLLAVMASMYAVYHGPSGLRRIAERVHRLAALLAEGLEGAGFRLVSRTFFDTVRVDLAAHRADELQALAVTKGINLGRPMACQLQISLDETTTFRDVEILLDLFEANPPAGVPGAPPVDLSSYLPRAYLRESAYLEADVFNDHHAETQMLRYMAKLEAKDLSLTHSMIPLGSCTMKLNATSEMMPITWSEFANIHPFAPRAQTMGYAELISTLEGCLATITGFAAVSVQPNAGSQGEFAGLLIIRKYHQERGQGQRDVCLIPSSAHGTNPASAVLAGMRVVVVGCDDDGSIDLKDLRAKVGQHSDRLAALMVTYPSTHGVFEEFVMEVCDIIHENGGQVYMDGANLNALVGLCEPGKIGPDVCHLNLHKTFCIPHGGGGPGVGPLAVAGHLQKYLPTHGLVPECGPQGGITAVSAAPWGSAGILPIAWAYIAMMGQQGLKKATQVAILSANYIAHRLSHAYSVLYRGKGGFVAHECIVDLRAFKTSANVTVEDVAKRLMDYGFHAPTMSWPVPGTLMIEPTECESLEELDYFCDAMLSIREEIGEIERGDADPDDNVLKNAPHSVPHLMDDEWPHAYSREKAAFPREWIRDRKFWIPVARVDNAFGDRHLVCSCAPVEAYAEE